MLIPTSGVLALGGDVVGPPAHNQLAAIQGEPLKLTGLGNKQALGHDNNEWHPVPMPQPATTGLPAPETFGATGSLGSNAGNASQIYARADHRHAMPPDPVPPHNIDAGAHRNLRLGSISPPITPAIALSDVRGSTEHNIVVGLQRVPVSNAPLNPSKDGFVLTYRSNQWRAEQNAFRVTSGLVIFEKVKPSKEMRFSPPIEHGFKDQLVMIRLGWAMGVEGETDLVEDINSWFPPAASMVVGYGNPSSTFVIGIKAAAKLDPWVDWVIRWWAVPVTESRERVIVPPGDQKEVPKEMIMGLAPLGMSVPEMAATLGVTEAKIQPVVDKLKTEGAIRVVKGRILPPA